MVHCTQRYFSVWGIVCFSMGFTRTCSATDYSTPHFFIFSYTTIEELLRFFVKPNSVMKRLFSFIACATVLASCGVTTPTSSNVISRQDATSLEGHKVVVEEIQMQGVEMVETLSKDGTDIIKRPHKWYAGIGTADNKQIAIEIAQGEAYATISRVLNNAVLAESERGAIVNNGRVQSAIRSHWEQVGAALVKGCEPFGNVSVEYNPASGMYTATAKVGIRGDMFNSLLANAGNFRPADLNAEEMEQFMAINKAILSAAKGD